ncbi:GlyGly-CTERM sorting domain-containing protein [Sphingomonas sp. SORGH_AS_0950]|uniref:GlyGly-CTERM sorting domain-containing protein n=1 Tax=Sphingomonas sp. SORGH_AS_0950 TaxID=3041792 RepID=UPI00358E61D2
MDAGRDRGRDEARLGGGAIGFGAILFLLAAGRRRQHRHHPEAYRPFPHRRLPGSLRFQLNVPVQPVVPCFMQIIGREAAPMFL